MLRKLALARSLPTPARVLRGGRMTDAGRLPRYALIFALGAGALWTPIATYVTMTPPSYTSEVSLILPGSGAQASVNLADIGQASTSSASAFSSSRVSPTQTYKRLLGANRTLARAAAQLDLDLPALGAPRVRLVDETSLIHFEMTGPSPEAAQARAAAVLDIFLHELDLLREDERGHREGVARAAIADYQTAVADLRRAIAEVQTASGLLSFEHYQQLIAERDALSGRMEAAEAAHGAADAAVRALSARLGVAPEVAARNLRLHADPEFQELAAALALQASTLAERRGQLGARHPQVTHASHAVNGLRDRLAARGQAVIGTAAVLGTTALDLASDPSRAGLLSDLVAQASEREARAATLTALQDQLYRIEARIARLAPLAARLDALEGEYRVAETVLSSALARTDTSQEDVFASYPLVQVLADASLPDRATSPRPKIAIAAGVAATLMLLMALALGWMRRPLIDRLLDRGASA
ncbi:hypothetical protein [Roseobacter sp. HKCCA0434]|uniref:hypothetical protein n=1 Tax=Roseobacter sp. HKCCA0434 TaxID=3079297 RepID=UPI002905CA62|nr:hypothetical protein [Roseobacter sp. HKCCA0434]